MEQKTSQTEIIVYATSWCPDCMRTRSFLDKNKITYQWIDIDKNAEGRKFVESVNRGNRSVPTILFSDGSILVEPSTHQLEDKFKISSS